MGYLALDRYLVHRISAGYRKRSVTATSQKIGDGLRRLVHDSSPFHHAVVEMVRLGTFEDRLGGDLSFHAYRLGEPVALPSDLTVKGDASHRSITHLGYAHGGDQ